MSGKMDQDPTDEHQTVPVQLHAARLEEIKQQWEEVKKLLRENRLRVPESPITGRGVVLIVIFAAVGWLAYVAYDDLAMRQREIMVSQDKLLESVEKLRREVGRDVKELKDQLADAVRVSSADEIKLLRNIESKIKRLEEKFKGQSSTPH